MTTINYPDVSVDDEGRATLRHVASHHVQGVPGGAELTLCGVLITYSTWKGVAPDAPECETCRNLDA